jgi:DNA-binding NarL/FixJ family response regulator
VIRALVIADSGVVMSQITTTLWRLGNVDIVAHANGRAPVDAMVRAVGPDVVLIDEMAWTGLALARIAEVREAAPLAAVVGLAERPDAPWVLSGLRAGAAAVVPRGLEPATLGLVLDEVLVANQTAVASGHVAGPAKGAA